MVKISVDEAYAFDILSIFEVKTLKCSEKKQSISKHAYELLKNELVDEIGRSKVEKILESEEYMKLINANEIVFNLIDEIRVEKNNSVANKIDDSNMERFSCKKKLQDKFFNGKLLEIKTYD
jgi:hypothetical protein